MNTSQLAKISKYPNCPLKMFKELIARTGQEFISMNLATLDSEFGVLNRTVMYRGFTNDSAVTFVTELNSRKYENLQKNPKVAITILLQLINYPVLKNETETNKESIVPETWQIRLLDAYAIELDPLCLNNLWNEEPLFAKIRSHISECGLPIDKVQFENKHNQLLADYQSGRNPLSKTHSYTAFKIKARCWDFYKSEPGKIADRLQYRLVDNENRWLCCHVAP